MPEIESVPLLELGTGSWNLESSSVGVTDRGITRFPLGCGRTPAYPSYSSQGSYISQWDWGFPSIRKAYVNILRVGVQEFCFVNNKIIFWMSLITPHKDWPWCSETCWQKVTSACLALVLEETLVGCSVSGSGEQLTNGVQSIREKSFPLSRGKVQWSKDQRHCPTLRN